ncbi:hypothetical protein CS8_093910 [Cupriavidus sp. 8B]
MNKIQALFLIAALSVMPIASAGGLSDSDVGTYEYLGQNHAPSGVLYRLSRSSGKWVASGKLPGKEWKDISCDPGCEYRNSTTKEIQSYFPSDWLANADIACIQNIAQAFCRFSPIKDPGKVGHMVIALVTGKPAPVMVRRVDDR